MNAGGSCKLFLGVGTSFQETTAESRTCMSIPASSDVNFSPPNPLTSDPALIPPFFRCSKHFFFGRGHPWPFLCGIILTSPQPPPFSQASSGGPSLSVSAFFPSSSLRDLPPQSHKSTEDRCLLCLIKALPPGVIPQFEQEEKPSEGGDVLDQSYEGPILYTLI